MIIQPRHFVRFIDGRAGDQISIAFLPGELGARIYTLQTNVSLRLDYAKKLVRHRIRYEGFSEIQNTIDNGMCMIADEYRLKFLYVKDQVRPEIYFLLIKTDSTRSELWLVTFHRVKKKQFTSRLDPSSIIRPHAEREFMG
jgi:hypothetical protein